MNYSIDGRNVGHYDICWWVGVEGDVPVWAGCQSEHLPLKEGIRELPKGEGRRVFCSLGKMIEDQVTQGKAHVRQETVKEVVGNLSTECLISRDK